MPLSPDLGRGEHTTRTALVTESSLTSTVRTATRDTGDTGDSTTWRKLYQYEDVPRSNILSISNWRRTGTPGLSRSLFTSLLAHSIGLALVLRDTGVNLPAKSISTISPIAFLIFDGLLDNVGTDWRLENGGQRNSRSAGLAIRRGDGDGRARRHFVDKLLVVVVVKGWSSRCFTKSCGFSRLLGDRW